MNSDLWIVNLDIAFGAHLRFNDKIRLMVGGAVRPQFLRFNCFGSTDMEYPVAIAPLKARLIFSYFTTYTSIGFLVADGWVSFFFSAGAGLSFTFGNHFDLVVDVVDFSWWGEGIVMGSHLGFNWYF